MSEEDQVDFGALFYQKDVVEVDPKPWMEEKTFTLITEENHLKDVIDRAIKAGYCALDLETTGLDNRIKDNGKTVHKIVGYCLSFDGEEGFYIPVRHKDEGADANMDPAVVIEEVRRLCDECVTIYHNAAFDHEFLYGEGIEIDSFKQFEDTLILDYLRDSSDKRHGLKHLSKRFLDLEMIELKELFAEEVKDRDFSTLDPTWDAVLWYAGSDAICTYLLFQWYREHKWVPRRVTKEITEENEDGSETTKRVQRTEFQAEKVSSVQESIYGNQPFVYYIEKICVPALRWMERNRPKIDLDYLTRVRTEVDLLINQVKHEIAEGIRSRGLDYFHEEDVSSPKKLGEALEYLANEGYINTKLQRTPSEQVQTSDDVITKLAEKVGDRLPFIKRITTFRKLQKVDGTYLRPLQENTDGYIKPDGTRNPGHELNDNTIRFSFLPHRVDTGRFAASKGKPSQGYSGINVQSMPAGYNVGKFSGKKIHRRPSGGGDEDPVLYDNFVEFIEGDFLIRLYDGHFVRDPLEDQEYCVRKGCEGCPFIEECEHEPEPDEGERNVKILSLDASARPAIVAREGYSIAAIDQSGVELRVAASISQEPKWIEEFYRCSSCDTEFGEPEDLTPKNPLGAKQYKVPNKPPGTCPNCGSDKIGDLHTLTTKIVYGDEVTKKPDFKQYRQKAKGANFSILYGGSGRAVARATGVSKEEGTFIRNKVLSGLPRLNTWFDEVIKTCKTQKQVATGVGRKIRLPDIDHEEGWISSKAERNAINSIIQGTATGDLTKYCMGQVYMYMKKEGLLDDCRLMITVHDELVFEVRNELMDELFPIITDLMTKLGDKMKWPVPLSCDVEIGQNFNVQYNWGAMHSYDPEAGKAEAPVPRYLWNRIDMQPGMWYVDDDGNEVVVEGVPEGLEKDDPDDPDPEEPEAEETIEVDESEEIIFSDIREHYMSIKESRKPKNRANNEGPIFTYQLDNGPGLYNGNDPIHIRTMLRYLYQIFDFFKAEGRGSYVLELLDWQGEVVISKEDKHLIEPDEFITLCRFFGLYGTEVQ